MNYLNPLSKRDNTKRNKQTIVAAIVSMSLNACLSALKIVLGVISGTISLVGDGLNNLSDCGSNLITVVGARMASKPADKEHPFGHARGEYVASICIAFLILLFAVELFSASMQKIIDGSSASGNAPIIVLCIGIAVKLAMFVFNFALSKKYSSEILKATAIDSLCDVASSAVVLISLLLSQWLSLSLDGYAGCFVAVIIAISGIKVIKKPISELLGESPSKEITDEIEKRLLSYQGIRGIHDLTVHNYVNKYYASVHAEIDGNLDVLAAHEIVDAIEHDFAANTDVELIIHVDPIVANEHTERLKNLICSIVARLDERFAVHDFRIIKRGNQDVLVFEVCVPFDTASSNESIQHDLLSVLSAELDSSYSFLITVEHAKIR